MLDKITDITRVCQKVSLLDVKFGIWRTCTDCGKARLGYCHVSSAQSEFWQSQM